MNVTKLDRILGMSSGCFVHKDDKGLTLEAPFAGSGEISAVFTWEQVGAVIDKAENYADLWSKLCVAASRAQFTIASTRTVPVMLVERTAKFGAASLSTMQVWVTLTSMLGTEKVIKSVEAEQADPALMLRLNAFGLISESDWTSEHITWYRADDRVLGIVRDYTMSHVVRASVAIPLAWFHISNVCRVPAYDLVAAVSAIGGLNPGVTQIPDGILQPRQLRLTDGRKGAPKIDADLKLHRGTWIPVLDRTVASHMIFTGRGVWEPQSLLVAAMPDYLADPDVQADAEELIRAQAAKDAGVELVVVAVIGNDRSTLAICRNIVSGCQDMTRLIEDAKGAMEASDVFLVED